MWKWERHPTKEMDYISYEGEAAGFGMVYKSRAGIGYTGYVSTTEETENFYHKELACAWVESKLPDVDGTAGLYSPPEEFKKFFPLLKGISLGRCVEGYEISSEVAHAHEYIETNSLGWLCFFKEHPFKNGLPTTTLLHEYAHLETWDEEDYHGIEWMRRFQNQLYKWGYENIVKDASPIYKTIRSNTWVSLL